MTDLYRIFKENGTTVKTTIAEIHNKSSNGDHIQLRSVYTAQEDVSRVFLGYKLFQKLGAKQCMELLGIPSVKLNSSPFQMNKTNIIPGTLYYYGPSGPGNGVGGTFEGASLQSNNLIGKWLYLYLPESNSRGPTTGMADTEDLVFEHFIDVLSVVSL